MAMELKSMKNDTARKNAIRTKLAEVIFKAIVEEFGADEAVLIKNKITVFDSDIAGDTVAVAVGMVDNNDGEEVEAVATISATVKSWNTVKNKSGRITNAVNMGDILMAIEDKNEELAEKEIEKQKKKEKAEADREKKAKAKAEAKAQAQAE